jgi:hypothetical protein
MAATGAAVLLGFLSSYASDPVAIFTQDYEQIFRNARAIKATVKEEAKLMEHPIETGATIVDHRIILPTEIELSLILTRHDYQDTYHQIREYYYNSTLLIIQTRSGIYENQLIQSMPHEEDPDQYDVLTLALSLKQVFFVTAQYGTVPKNPSNVNTSSRGVQQGTPANSSQGGTYLGAILGGNEIANPKNLPS